MNHAALQTLSPIGPGLTPQEVEQRAIEAFDFLNPGEHLTVILDQAPAHLWALFRARRIGEFDWTPTREGPETWQIEISRRGTERGALRAVNEALSWDHDRLDELEARAFAARSLGDFPQAVLLFSTFAFGLRRHIRFEEELLFPEFEAKSGFPSTMGPTAVMRSEHEEILDLIGQIEKTMSDPGAKAESLRNRLHAVLVPHNLKEENVVYPGTDAALTPGERDDLVARIQML